MNPATKWDIVPVYGVYMRAPGDTAVSGSVEFALSQRITRTDGRTIYPEGAKVRVTIGAADEQNATVRAAVRSAWRAVDEDALGEDFDGTAWDIWWDTVVLPAAIFTGFPAADDPDIVQQDWTVTVKESLTGGGGKQYAIQPLLAHNELPIPGINLGVIEVPPGAPSVPAPVYAKGIAGGVAALDVDGDVVDAAGNKVVGGGGSYIGDSDDITEGTTKLFVTPAEKAKIDNLTAVATSGAYSDLSGRPSIPSTKGDVGLGNVDNTSDANKPLSTAATNALAAKADLDGSGKIPTSQLPPLAVNETFTAANQAAMLALTAQRGDMAIRTDNGRTYVLSSDSPSTLADWKEVQAAGQVTSVAGKSGSITLVKADVGLGNVDNTTDMNKPVSTAQAAAITAENAGIIRQIAYTGAAWPTRSSGIPAGYTGVVMWFAPDYSTSVIGFPSTAIDGDLIMCKAG